MTRNDRAIAVHSGQAVRFEARYAEGEFDRYATTFAYSRARLRGLLDRYLPSAGGERVLDVGCGTGYHVQRLHNRGFHVVGVDGSAEMLAYARAGNPDVEFHHADVRSLPVPNESFDIAVCIEVLRYLPDPQPCLREIARVLRPGGVCLATALPLLNLNAYALVNRVALILPTTRLTRLKQYPTTSRRLRRELSRAGLGDVRMHGVYIGPVDWVGRLTPGRLPAFLRRWERLDRALADRPLMRELANMSFVKAVRET